MQAVSTFRQLANSQLVLISLIYGILRYCAQGKSQFPIPEVKRFSPFGTVGIVAHFIAFPALITVIIIYEPFGDGLLGQTIRTTMVLLIAAIFPASAAVMAFTNNLPDAFDLKALHSVVRTLGRDYAVMVVACFAVVGIAELLQSRVLSGFGFLAYLIAESLQVWATLAVFALIGSILYTHRDAIEIPGLLDTEEEYLGKQQTRNWQLTLDRAYGSIRGGLAGEGYEILKRLIAENDNSWQIHYWLFDRMIEWDEPIHALRLGETMLERHLNEDDIVSAYDLYLRCRRVSETFRISAENSRALAAHAISIGQTGIASELVSPV